MQRGMTLLAVVLVSIFCFSIAQAQEENPWADEKIRGLSEEGMRWSRTLFGFVDQRNLDLGEAQKHPYCTGLYKEAARWAGKAAQAANSLVFLYAQLPQGESNDQIGDVEQGYTQASLCWRGYKNLANQCTGGGSPEVIQKDACK